MPKASPAERAFAMFLDTSREFEDREDALNDAAVSDEDLHAFIASRPPKGREIALAFCRRAAVLDHWARVGTTDERAVIGYNGFTQAATLRLLAIDPEPRVRGQLFFNANAPRDVCDLLCQDRDPVVQDMMRTALDMARQDAAEDG